MLLTGESAAVVCGGTMHKVRPARFLTFISIWSVVVYDPVARWSWDPDGWSNKLGVMDFAGGTPVHIVSGTTVAAFAVFCAIERQNDFKTLVKVMKTFLKKGFKRLLRPLLELWRILVSLVQLCAACFGKQFDDRDSHSDDEGETEERRVPFEPYNVNYLVLGTALLWFGWAGFNGGSALGGNLRAVSAWTSTHIAACAGGTVGVFLIWNKKILAWLYNDVGHEQAFDNLTVIHFCDGAIAGLGKSPLSRSINSYFVYLASGLLPS
jgi:Amt family ammonium transporter